MRMDQTLFGPVGSSNAWLLRRRSFISSIFPAQAVFWELCSPNSERLLLKQITPRCSCLHSGSKQTKIGYIAYLHASGSIKPKHTNRFIQIKHNFRYRYSLTRNFSKKGKKWNSRKSRSLVFSFYSQFYKKVCFIGTSFRLTSPRGHNIFFTSLILNLQPKPLQKRGFNNQNTPNTPKVVSLASVKVVAHAIVKASLLQRTQLLQASSRLDKSEREHVKRNSNFSGEQSSQTNIQVDLGALLPSKKLAFLYPTNLDKMSFLSGDLSNLSLSLSTYIFLKQKGINKIGNLLEYSPKTLLQLLDINKEMFAEIKDCFLLLGIWKRKVR